MPKRTNRQWAGDPNVIKARERAVMFLRPVYTYKEISVAIGRTPEQVRRIEAKARRLWK